MRESNLTLVASSKTKRGSVGVTDEADKSTVMRYAAPVVTLVTNDLSVLPTTTCASDTVNDRPPLLPVVNRRPNCTYFLPVRSMSCSEPSWKIATVRPLGAATTRRRVIFPSLPAEVSGCASITFFSTGVVALAKGLMTDVQYESTPYTVGLQRFES